MAAVVFKTANFRSNMKRIQGEVARQLGLAVIDGGNKLVAVTFKDVPLRDGDLESGDSVEIDVDGFSYCAGAVRYNANAPHNGFNYALLQHEQPFPHPKKGKQYYLQSNVMASRQLITDVMAASIRTVL